MPNALMQTLHWLGAPANYYRLCGVLAPLAALAGVALAAIAAWLGLVAAPVDYQQGEVFRIIYVHVPAAWLALMIYSSMTVVAITVLVWRVKICEHLLATAAPIGAWVTALALLTGAIWGKPTWGAYWVWGDARLTSVLVLFFIYLGIYGVLQANADARLGARAAALLTVIGAVNLPIIRYSVLWWSSLHQGDSINITGKVAIASPMLSPLALMGLAYVLLFLGLWHMRVQASLLADYPKLRDAAAGA